MRKQCKKKSGGGITSRHVVSKAQTHESSDKFKTIILGLRRAGSLKSPRSQPESSQCWEA